MFVEGVECNVHSRKQDLRLKKSVAVVVVGQVLEWVCFLFMLEFD